MNPFVYSSASPSSSDTDLSVIDSSDSDANYDGVHGDRTRVGNLFMPMMQSTVGRTPRHGGTSYHRRYAHRDREAAHDRLMQSYFVPAPMEDTVTFRRRYRMHQPLFNKIMNDVCHHDVWFQSRPDALGRLGCTPQQKVTAALRVMAYGSPFDGVAELLSISQGTIKEALKRFCVAIVEVYQEEYLRKPNLEDLRRLMRKGRQRGFPGMIGSLDCMHWVWQACPMAEQGVYRGHYHVPTVILEAVASYDTWIWHANFGFPGSFNDISVLDCSHLFDAEISGRAFPVKYRVNDIEFKIPYYLADGIYPPWATLISAMRTPIMDHHKLFSQRQESFRKDVERAFGILKARWQIIKRPARMQDPDEMGYIMKACIILHNMIIDDERPDGDPAWVQYSAEETIQRAEAEYDGVEPSIQGQQPSTLPEEAARRHLIRNRHANAHLRENLIEHIWIQAGGGTHA